MCLAIVKLPQATLPADSIKAGWIINPDGAGFAFNQDGNIVVSKGHMTLKEFGVAYDAAARANPKATFLVHFRIRTQGDRNQENTHPFHYDNMAMIHNGNIDGTGAKYGTGKSDTALFVEQFKDDLTLENIRKYQKELECALSYNKLCFLRDDGQHAILNENSGTWVGGVWYSNHSFRSRQTYPVSSMMEEEDDNMSAWYRSMQAGE